MAKNLHQTNGTFKQRFTRVIEMMEMPIVKQCRWRKRLFLKLRNDYSELEDSSHCEECRRES